MKNSLKHVASESGFSIRTVKRALTGLGYVNEETRSKILEVVDRLAYRPNLTARALKTGRSCEMGVVLTSIDELHTEKLAGFEQALRREGYSVHVLFSPAETGEADVPEVANALMVRRPAGVALFPGPTALISGLTRRLAELGVPHVLLDPRHDEPADTVRVDRPQGVYEAVMHMAGRGRGRIAYLGPAGDRSRLDGYERAMKALGRDPVVFAVHGPVEERANVNAAAGALLAAEPRPDAVQAYSDVTAMNLLAALHQRGIRVPEDVAVVGFDDRDFAALAWPRLTTVAQPNREVGAAAAEILLGRVSAAPAPDGGWSRTLPTRLVVRESA